MRTEPKSARGAGLVWPTTRSRRRRVRPGRWILAISITLFAGGLGVAPSAHAGKYSVLICSGSPNVGPGPFSQGGAQGPFATDQTCREGGALRVADDGAQNRGQLGTWRITGDDAAPGQLTPVRLIFRARGKAEKGVRPEIEARRRGSGWVRLAAAGNLPERRFRTITREGPFAAMRLTLRCERRGGCPEGAAHVRAKRIRFVVEDSTSPSAPDPEGELVEQPVQRDMQVLGSEQRDRESGLAGVSVWVNGSQVSRLAGSCKSGGRGVSGRISLGFWRPCANTVTGAPVQTNDGGGPWREGLNEMRLCAVDFAGNTSCSEPRRVRVDNTCPISSPGDTAQPPRRLRLTFGDGSRSKGVRFPRAPRLRASLLGVGGEELPTGSPSICVGQTLRMADTPLIQPLTPTIQTGAPLGVAPRASRIFFANYWLDEERVLTARARLRVRTRPQFEIRPKQARVGRKVRLITRLPGPRAQRKGITLQVKQGRHWRMFRTGRTNRNGVHRRTYRFRTVVGKVRFRFRAQVPRQRGYPYVRGTSKPRSIIISG